jgi:hypothetical protein
MDRFECTAASAGSLPASFFGQRLCEIPREITKRLQMSTRAESNSGSLMPAAAAFSTTNGPVSVDQHFARLMFHFAADVHSATRVRIPGFNSDNSPLQKVSR